MKKATALVLFSFLFLFYALAQTKKIALASHSGKAQEFNINGDGNFGNNPIWDAQMRRYADSIRKSDSVKAANRKIDSIHRIDSIKQAKKMPAPKNQSKKKPKGIHAAADFGSTKTVIGYK